MKGNLSLRSDQDQVRIEFQTKVNSAIRFLNRS